MLEADVVVVGCGPAGAATAITAAQEGLRTIVLSSEARGQAIPGETLHPGAENLFQALGVSDAVDRAVAIRHAGHWTQSPTSRQFTRFGGDPRDPWRGYQIRRSALRDILVARAEDVGACVKDQWRAVRPIRQGARIVGVETSHDAIACRFLVDASGASQWLARANGDLVKPMSAPLVAWYGWAVSDQASLYAEPLLSIEGSGWCWIAQIAHDTCAWTRLGSGEKPISRLTKPRMLNGFKALGREHGADVTWRYVARQGGPGYLRVGDAGGILDPASSHGVLRALMTGLCAARCLARIIQSRRSERNEIAKYDQWTHQWFKGLLDPEEDPSARRSPQLPLCSAPN